MCRCIAAIAMCGVMHKSEPTPKHHDLVKCSVPLVRQEAPVTPDDVSAPATPPVDVTALLQHIQDCGEPAADEVRCFYLCSVCVSFAFV